MRSKRAVRSLGGIFKEARRRGLASHYPTDDLDLDFPERDDPRVVAPTKAELQAIIAGAAGRWRPLILVAIFCGLRASELRGLRWEDVNFEDREISIKQRADARNRIGKLKSKAAYRAIPMPSVVVNTLREWRLLCPKGELGLVFPSGAGKAESHSNVAQRGLEPVLRKAGIVVLEDGLDDEGKPVKIAKPKYGLHSLRHAAASLWIQNGTNAKRIQTLMGHSSITVTYDRYGHRFADECCGPKGGRRYSIPFAGKVMDAAPLQHGLAKALIRLSTQRFCKPKVGSSILSTGTTSLADMAAPTGAPIKPASRGFQAMRQNPVDACESRRRGSSRI